MPVTDGNCELGGLGSLSVRGPDAGVDVAERIDALDLDKATIGVVRQPDVRGEAGVGWLGRELERPSATDLPTQSQR